MIKKIFFYCLFFFLLLRTGNMSGAEYRLGDLVQLARKNNPDLQILLKKVEEQKEKVLKARSALYPLSNFSFTYTRVGVVPEVEIFQMPPMKFATSNSLSSVLTLNYNLWDWGASRLRIKAEENFLENARLNLLAQEKTVALQIGTIFQTVVQLQEQEKIVLANLKIASEIYQLSEQRFRQGYIPEYQLLQAEINRQAYQQQLLEVKKQIELSLFAIKEICGLNPEKEVFLVAEEVNNPDQLLGPDLAEIVNKRIELRSLALQKSVLRKLISALQAARLPSVNLIVNAELRNNILPDVEKLKTNWNINLKVAYQVFDGGAAAKDLQILKKQLEQLELNYQKQKTNIEFRFISLRQELAILSEQLQAARKRVELAEKSLQQVMESFQSGYATYLDVLSSQNNLNQLQLNQLNLEFSFQLNLLKLKNEIFFREDE